MENKLLITKLIKKNGRLVFKNASDQSLFAHLASQMKEGQVVTQMTDFENSDALLSQISKVHAMIREISKETGDTFQATKVTIKKQCGLVTLGGELKSFADCNFQEMSDVIQHLIETGDFIGINLR